MTNQEAHHSTNPVQPKPAGFLADQEGATAVEYAIMLALIIAVCMASVGFLATSTQDSFNDSAAAINGAIGN